MDGNASVKYECSVWDNGHIHQLDQQTSGPHKTVYLCACGNTIEEFEDAGTGA